MKCPEKAKGWRPRRLGAGGNRGQVSNEHEGSYRGDGKFVNGADGRAAPLGKVPKNHRTVHPREHVLSSNTTPSHRHVTHGAPVPMCVPQDGEVCGAGLHTVRLSSSGAPPYPPARGSTTASANRVLENKTALGFFHSFQVHQNATRLSTLHPTCPQTQEATKQGYP